LEEASQPEPTQGDALREEIRAELEDTRQAYHALLDSLTE
jgi:hypothetical protein